MTGGEQERTGRKEGVDNGALAGGEGGEGETKRHRADPVASGRAIAGAREGGGRGYSPSWAAISASASVQK